MTDKLEIKSKEILEEEEKIQKNMSQRLLKAKQPIETVFTWKAPERFFEKKETRWFVIVSAIALFVIVMAAMTNNFVLIFAIICLVLVIYSLYTIPPKIIEHQITNKGIYTLNTLYPWSNMAYFWISQRGGQFIINVQYRKRATDFNYQRMFLLIPQKDYKAVALYMSDYTDYLGPEEISRGILSTFAEGKYISLKDILEAEVNIKKS